MILLVIISLLLWLFVSPRDQGPRSALSFFIKWLVCKLVWDFFVTVAVKTWNRTAGRLFGYA